MSPTVNKGSKKAIKLNLYQYYEFAHNHPNGLTPACICVCTNVKGVALNEVDYKLCKSVPGMSEPFPSTLIGVFESIEGSHVSETMHFFNPEDGDHVGLSIFDIYEKENSDYGAKMARVAVANIGKAENEKVKDPEGEYKCPKFTSIEYSEKRQCLLIYDSKYSTIVIGDLFGNVLKNIDVDKGCFGISLESASDRFFLHYPNSVAIYGSSGSKSDTKQGDYKRMAFKDDICVTMLNKKMTICKSKDLSVVKQIDCPGGMQDPKAIQFIDKGKLIVVDAQKAYEFSVSSDDIELTDTVDLFGKGEVTDKDNVKIADKRIYVATEKNNSVVRIDAGKSSGGGKSSGKSSGGGGGLGGEGQQQQSGCCTLL